MAELTSKESIEILTTRRTSLENVSSKVSQQLRSSSFHGTLKSTSYKLASNRQTRRMQTDLYTRGISNTIYTTSLSSKQILSGYSSGSTTLDGTTTGIFKSSSKVHSYDVLIAVLTVSAIVFVISVAVVVVCRLRRQGPFRSKTLKSSETVEMHEPNYHDFNNTHYNGPTTLHSNTAYDTHNIERSRNSDQTFQNKQSTSNDQYSIVMKSTPDTTESRLDRREEMSFDIKENEYDRLNDIKDRGRNDSNNIYDSSSGLRDNDDPTYNTTSQMNIRSRDGTANIYDSTSGLRNENDPTYNTRSKIDDKNNCDNSVYDHV
ncbi:uncharacterized protein [Mytilus edulis]|uniref:uncharacterized protein n=1 Tax=Mytilus edulis TaxID=6550 RepID=UPI0039F03CEF